MSFQSIIKESWIENKDVEGMEALIKDWILSLQEMSDKAEKFDDVENNMYWINDHLDEIDNMISHIRNQSDV